MAGTSYAMGVVTQGPRVTLGVPLSLLQTQFVGNAICADGAAAFLLAAGEQANRSYPQIIDFETFIDTEQIEEVGLQHRDGKLRIVLGASIKHLAGPMIENGTQVVAAATWTFQISHRLLGCSSRWTQGD
jgi:hypothetical protein